jgi:PAS domain S-box-containing protein
VVLVQEGKILFANPAAWEHLGYEKGDLVGRDFVDFVHGDSADEVKALHRKRLAGRLAPSLYEAHVVTNEGESVCCEVRVRKLRYRGKRAFLASIVDVGKRKEKEKAWMQSIKREALIRLAGGVCGELKQWKAGLQRRLLPLQGGREKTSPEDPQWNGVWGEIQAAMAEGDQIIGELEGLSKKEMGGDAGVLRFDLRKAVREAAAAARAGFEEEFPEKSANITLKTYLRATSPVYGNPEEMKQAVAAVIRNAMDALPPEGQIYISTEEAGGFANVYVQDDGLSIPQSTVDRIFDPYFTTSTGRKRGMGLSLAHAAVSRHQGEIEVISGTGRGATFTIRLPVARKPKARARRQVNLVKDSRILILSEEGIVRDLLSQVFTSKGGKVRTAATDREGLNLLKKSRFDLVIADPGTLPTNLPEMISRIKQMGRQLPVALVNAASEERKFGADLVVGKPLDVDRILPLVSSVLASRGTTA